MLSDIDIAQAATRQPIVDIAQKLGLSAEQLIPYGHHIAKIQQETIQQLQQSPAKAKLILVTAISPTPAGEGKTTTTIGLTDALNHIGHQTLACLREPSLGPVFGMKGGATGGGYAQVVPMENINLHFTGDFHAISSANNLLAALLDNHIHQGNTLGFENITWRRCMDMNDRALRRLTVNQPFTYDTGFDITVASEVMAIFCLARDLADLTHRLGQIQVGISTRGQPILAKDLQAEGAMTALLKDAFQPNLVQTLAGSPALVHGGPFANIAHGCNSLVATQAAMRLADFVVTEAGFGADLGAEKFMDIKCRLSGLRPNAAVVVATIRALKYHGGVDVAALNQENLAALKVGLQNLQRHLHNLHEEFGLPVVVALNHFTHDTDAEITLVKACVADLGYAVHVCKHWAQGAPGAVGLAHAVAAISHENKPAPTLLYDNDLTIEQKLSVIARKLYGATGVELSAEAQNQLKVMEPYAAGMPVCVAKTQYSFSCDPAVRNAPKGHTLLVRELRLSRGAGFVVAVCGDIMTMPGLPKQPASARIGVDESGRITGLS